MAEEPRNDMKSAILVQDLLFDVDQVPVEAVIGSNGNTRRIAIPGKKALVNQRTGHILGVVSRDYRVVANQEEVSLARDVCGQAFPGLLPPEWETGRAAAPRTLMKGMKRKQLNDDGNTLPSIRHKPTGFLDGSRLS